MNSRVCGLILVAALGLGGCASASKPDAMQATPVAAVHKSSSAVSVTVSGGKETSKMGASQISNQDFARALQGSIEKSGLFSSAVSGPGSRYQLVAFIGKLDQPMFAFATTVTMEVSYTLTDSQTRKTVWSQSIASTYTAKTSDAFVGVTRLRLANEGVARENIRQMLEAVSTLNLQ